MTAISEELSDALTFADLRFANEARQAHWGGTDNWTLSDWSNAVAGEVGEACNIVKKIRRPELGTTGNSEDVSTLYPKLESEIGDVLIYLDLLAKKAGTTLDRCVMRAFNEKSEALGMPVRLQSLRSGNGGEVVAVRAVVVEVEETGDHRFQIGSGNEASFDREFYYHASDLHVGTVIEIHEAPK